MRAWALICSGVALAVGGAVLVAMSVTDGHERETTPVVDKGTLHPLTASASVSPDHSERPIIHPRDRSHELGLARRQLAEEEAGADVASRQAGGPIELRRQVRALIDHAPHDSRPQVTVGPLKQQLSELSGQEVDLVAVLKEEYRRSEGDVARATTVIHALQAIGSPQATEVLRGIALDPGKDGFTLGSRAVKAYAAITRDSGKMAELLDTKEPQAADVAIEQMRGLPLADSAVNALEAQLNKSKSWVTHQLVAQVLGMDPRENTAKRRVRMLMSASTTLDQLHDADAVVPISGFTAREMALMIYAGAVANMRGSERALRRYLDDDNEVRRVMAATSLARQGHRDVHDNVLDLASQSKDGLLRLIAVSALGKVATEQDRAIYGSLHRMIHTGARL